MLRHVSAVLFLAGLAFAQAKTDLSGTWVFTHMNDRFRGTIVLRQTGIDLTGTWHTHSGKNEPDTSVIGRVDGFTVVLTRLIGNNQQNFILTLSPDGKQLDGFGDGGFLKHGNLNMQRVTAKDGSTKTSTDRLAQNSPAPVPGPRANASSTTQLKPGRSTSTPAPAKQRWMGITAPPPRGTWRWVIQSVVTRSGSGRKFTSFYYEAPTDRSVEQPLSLPAGGEIVGVFPDDCAFSVRDQAGHAFTFQNGDQAIAKGFAPGIWSVFPLKCGGIAVYVK